MFAEPEQVDLPLFLIPIAANALKAAGTIGKTMGAYRDDTTIDGYELAVHKKFFCIHLAQDK